MAASLWLGLSSGCYQLPTPDLGLQLHSRLVQGITPRSFPGVLLDMLLGCMGPAIHWVVAASQVGCSSCQHWQWQIHLLEGGGEAGACCAWLVGWGPRGPGGEAGGLSGHPHCCLLATACCYCHPIAGCC